SYSGGTGSYRANGSAGGGGSGGGAVGSPPPPPTDASAVALQHAQTGGVIPPTVERAPDWGTGSVLSVPPPEYDSTGFRRVWNILSPEEQREQNMQAFFTIAS